MSISSVVNHFLSKGLECSIINRFHIDTNFISTEKESDLRGKCNAKTLLLRVKNKNILIVTSEDKRISNKKFKDYFKVSPKELSNRDIVRVTGHPMDGLSPFGLKSPLKIYIDICLKRKNYIYLCAGLKNFVVAVTGEDIINLTCGEWIDICEDSTFTF